jgi:hypothetical protein
MITSENPEALKWIDKCAELTREKEALRLLAIELLKELVIHCPDPIHAEQLKALQPSA